MNNKNLIRLVALSLTLAAAAATAEETPPRSTEGAMSIGIVKVVRGDARVRSAVGDASRAASAGSEVYEADRIMTGPDSGVSLVLRDGATLVLGPSSRLDMKEFKFDATTHDGRLLISLLRGSLRMVTGKLGKKHPEAERIETPTAVIGIRGTDFVVNVDGDV